MAGERAIGFLDGAQVSEIAIGSRNRGDIVLLVHSDPVFALLRLEVEGKLDLERARQRWIARQLVDYGFPR